MIATTEHMEILDKAEIITDMILKSENTRQYKEAYFNLQNDQEAQRLIRDFTHMKDLYEDVQRFGHYHPDYQEIMRNVRASKRDMDLHHSVSAFKVEERKFQRFLDDISEYLARGVSETVMVPRDGLAMADSGCSSGGSCGTGGSCGC